MPGVNAKVNGSQLFTRACKNFPVHRPRKDILIKTKNDKFDTLFKGATSRYFELFLPSTKLPLNSRKPENNTLQR